MKAFAMIGLGTTLLVGAAPTSAGAAAYRHYVGCGITAQTKPAHVCAKGSKKGAFFESRKEEVLFSVCLKPAVGKTLCAHAQPTQAGALKVNKITATYPGRYRVTWFVEGKQVGSFAFRVSG
jgi:hypothetical protein